MSAVKVVHMTSAHPALDLRIFQKECRSLARAGLDVTMIGPYAEDETVDQVHIKAIPIETDRLRRMTLNVWRVYREACRSDADLYHFHDFELIAVGLALRAKGKKVIYDIHEDMPRGVLSKHYLPGWTRPALAKIVASVEEFAARRFSALVPVTPSIAERFIPLNEKTVIVHNYPFSQTKPAGTETIRWEKRDMSVVYVGGVTAQRGIREMVEAISLVPASLNAALEIAGNEVPEHCRPQELQRHPGWKRVHHRGVLNQAGVAELLDRVRAGLVIFLPKPNHIEAMPQKLFEYMKAGIPVIASDFPLWRKILEEAGSGILVDPTNPAAIAAAIEYVLTHPKEAEAMGRAGRTAVARHYTWETQGAKLVRLYRDLLDGVPGESAGLSGSQASLPLPS